MVVHEVSGTWGEGRIAELGGCVLSWTPSGREQLFLSREAELIPGEMWYGGVPVCAPWFGAGRGDVEVPFGHGLVSRVPWRTELVESDDASARVVLAVSAQDTAHLPGADRYPADLTYRLEVRMSASALTIELAITSPTRDVVVDQAFHPYFRVDATNASLSGLESVPFRDGAAGWRPDAEDHPVTFGTYVDRIYDAPSPTVLRDDSRCFELSGSGAAGVVVWNPGPDNNQVADGEWEQFVCVEYGNVQGKAVTIPAGGTHRLAFTAKV